MIKIIEYKSNLGMHFEFADCENMLYFDKISKIILTNFNGKLQDEINGPYSSIKLFVVEEMKIKLLNHPETGNSIILEDASSYQIIKEIAMRIANKLEIKDL
ncbi:MAG: hypothetical protein KAX49_20760 [Halanaerobiales bacterium]|nr:hypothetical protein [Halanaerobiales bacterium]